MRRTTPTTCEIMILSAVMLLTVGACVDRINAGLAQREQSNRHEQRQSAGRDLQNLTVNVVGDDVLVVGASIGGLMAVGWWVASRGRRINAQALKDIVHGVEMFKTTVKREGPTESVPAAVVLAMLERANNFQQGTKTRTIVKKIRGKNDGA